MGAMKTPLAAVLSLLALACHAPSDRRAIASAATALEVGRIEGLGRVEFPNSGPAQAQEAFVRGVLLLHSFEYVDSAEAFREAQALAPDFALAYWGEALTHNHPIWQEEDRQAAQAVLARLAPTPDERAAKCGDERERALLAAVEDLFGEGTRTERARGYEAALAALAARHPADLELAAFHALAILGTATQGRDVPTYMRAAAVAEEVLERAPDHPGALHYAIHSYDDPVHAPLGLRMARRYGRVAAAAEHGLHMPSHIYVALGLWTDSVASNVAASRAADARRARKGLGVDARGFHSLAWLAYSHLQLADVRAAEGLLVDMLRDEEESHSKRARGALIDMRAAHVVDRQEWIGPYASRTVEVGGLEPARVAAELYVRGRAALARDDAAAAREALAGIERERGPLETLPKSAGGAQCCFAGDRSDYLPDRLAAHVLELELSGLIALHAGATEEALARLAAAAEKEDAMGYDFGPPVVVEPAHELLGVTLLDLDRASEAAREFELALMRAPGRRRSLEGLAAARARLEP
jgi:tetratricopeptide (TPR) repeat protein